MGDANNLTNNPQFKFLLPKEKIIITILRKEKITEYCRFINIVHTSHIHPGFGDQIISLSHFSNVATKDSNKPELFI